MVRERSTALSLSFPYQFLTLISMQHVLGIICRHSNKYNEGTCYCRYNYCYCWSKRD